jgi:hypothetical protein
MEELPELSYSNWLPKKLAPDLGNMLNEAIFQVPNINGYFCGYLCAPK